LVRFNSRFEAYNRQLLYGTEVLTVVNMAIDNNARRAYDEDGNPIFINVIIDLSNDPHGFRGFTEEVRRDSRGHRLPGGGRDYNTVPSLAGNTVHQLFGHGGIQGGIMTDTFVAFFNSNAVNPPPIRDISDNQIISIYTQSALSEFRTSTFRATAMEHNESGRINSITFERVIRPPN